MKYFYYAFSTHGNFPFNLLANSVLFPLSVFIGVLLSFILFTRVYKFYPHKMPKRFTKDHEKLWKNVIINCFTLSHTKNILKLQRPTKIARKM